MIDKISNCILLKWDSKIDTETQIAERRGNL